MVETMVDALVCVEIVPVDLMVTIDPDKLIFSADTVMRCWPSADARAMICLVEPLIRLMPLNWAFVTTDVICCKRAWKFAFKACRLAVLTDVSDADNACCFIWISRLEMDCPAERATSMVDAPLFRLSLTAA